MGVHGASRKFLYESIPVSSKMSLDQLYAQFPDQTVFVDLFGSFYPKLPKSHDEQDFEIFIKWLGKHLPPSDNLILVMDGKGSKEKAAVHLVRRGRRVKSLKTWTQLLRDINLKHKISKAKWKAMIGAKNQSFRMTDEDKKLLMKMLKNAKYKVSMADGEADVHIAKAIGGGIAISGDSDFLFHRNIKICARPWWLSKRCLSFEVIERELVLKSLRMTQNQLVALAIVSGNDYAKHVPNYPIKKCLEIIPTIQRGKVSDIVSSFLDQVGLLPDDKRFENSIKIFDRLEETVIDSPDGDLAYDWDEQNLRFAEAVQIYQKWKEEMRSKPSDTSRLHLKYSNPNQFRPVYEKDKPPRYSYYDYYRDQSKSKKPQAKLNTKSKKRRAKNLNNKDPKKPKHDNSKKEPKVQRAKSSKQAIKNSFNRSGIPKSEKQKRENCPEKKFLDDLAKSYEIKTWSIGCLRKRLRVGLEEWVKKRRELIMTGAILDDEAMYSGQTIKKAVRQIDQRIRDAIMFLNLLKRKAQVATSLWVQYVMESGEDSVVLNNLLIGGKPSPGSNESGYTGADKKSSESTDAPSTSSESKSNDNKRKREDIVPEESKADENIVQVDDTVDDSEPSAPEKSTSNGQVDGKAKRKEAKGTDHKGALYYQGLMNYLKNGWSGSSDVAVEGIIDFLDKHEIKPEKIPSLSNFTLTTAIGDLAPVLANEFALLVEGELPRLQARVLQYNESFASKVDDIYRTSKSRYETFWKTNMLLPERLQFENSPLSGPTHSYIELTEVALLEILNGMVPNITKANARRIEKEEKDSPVKRLLREFIGHQKKDDYKASANGPNKGMILRKFFGDNFGRKYITVGDVKNLQDKENVGSRYVLRTTFLTNGLEIQVHASDTSCKKHEFTIENEPKSDATSNDKIENEAQSKGSKRPKLSNAASVKNAAPEIAQSKYGKTPNEVDLSVDQQKTPSEIAKSNPDKPVPSTENSKLENEKKRFSMPKIPEVTKLADGEPLPEIICGIDLGATYTVGACAKGFDKNKREFKRLLSIKRRALNEPTRKFLRWLSVRKSLPKMEYLVTLEAESPYRNVQADESIKDYWKRYFERYEKLSAFYNSRLVQKKCWDQSKAQRGEYDRAVNAILKMVDGQYHKKYEGNNPPMFVLGSATFTYKNSLHTSFERYFIGKIKPLGYRIVSVNEDYTSQMSPLTETKTEWISMRIKKSGDVYFHRDIMAGENMVNAAKSIMETGKRPDYLTEKKAQNESETTGKREATDDSEKKKRRKN